MLRSAVGEFSRKSGAGPSGGRKRHRTAALQKLRQIAHPSNLREVLECGGPVPLFLKLPLSSRLKIIWNLQAVRLEFINRFHNGWRSTSFEPGGRTPGILVGYRNQSVLYGILMYVVESCEVRFLIRQPCLSKVKPCLASNLAVQLVDPTGSLRMQHSQHRR